VPLSPSSITWYRSKGGCLATGEYRHYGLCASVTAVLPPPGQCCRTICLNCFGNPTSSSAGKTVRFFYGWHSGRGKSPDNDIVKCMMPHDSARCMFTHHGMKAPCINL